MLILSSVIVLCCVFFNKISDKFGLPALLAFILLGMLFGSDGLFKIEFDNYKFAEEICSVGLVFIIFYGGFGTKWSEAKKVAGKSLILASAGVLLTAFATGAFCKLVAGKSAYRRCYKLHRRSVGFLGAEKQKAEPAIRYGFNTGA